MNKKGLTAAVVGLLVMRCSAISFLGPRPTSSPTVISPEAFLVEQLYPLLFRFQQVNYAMQGLGETDYSSDLPSGIRVMADSLRALENLDPLSVPLCAKAGLAQAIQGEAMILTTWGTLAYECVPGPVSGMCYVDQADQDMQAGDATRDLGIAQIETD